MDKYLVNQHIIENNKKTLTDKKYEIFWDNNKLQICFYSIGCRYGKINGCFICNYGNFRKTNLKPKEITEIFIEIFHNINKKPDVLLIDSLGSIFDEFEMPIENINVLLDEIAKTDINTIIFETHYSTINKNILNLIKQKLKNKEIIIELGLESSNTYYRENYLNKIIDNNIFIEKINLIKSYGFSIDCNLIFGMPFLSIENQKKDTLESIEWCFKNNVDDVVLFPINIKPYTLLYKLYKEKKYQPVKHKDFIDVLKLIPSSYIEKVYISWYGNRQANCDEQTSISPICKKSEYKKLITFYENFNLNKDKEFRINLLKNILI